MSVGIVYACVSPVLIHYLLSRPNPPSVSTVSQKLTSRLDGSMEPLALRSATGTCVTTLPQINVLICGTAVVSTVSGWRLARIAYRRVREDVSSRFFSRYSRGACGYYLSSTVKVSRIPSLVSLVSA